VRNHLLHVVTPFNNPLRWASRLANFRRFEDGMIAAGVQLRTVELAYGDRPFELPDRDGVMRLRFRTRDILWHKENLGNLGFAAGPWEYGALIDGDFMFADPQWAAETVHALQLFPIVQMSSELASLGPRGEHLAKSTSVMAVYRQAREAGRPIVPSAYGVAGSQSIRTHGYPGGAWGYRREAFDRIGGLLDRCIVGAGDHHMAMGLLDATMAGEPHDLTKPYQRYLDIWAARARRTIQRDVGLVPGLALHFWHGKPARRLYQQRPVIIRRNEYDPHEDVHYDGQGLLCLAGNKPDLRDDLRAYFSARDEDSVDFG